MTAASITPRKALLSEITTREPRVAPGFNEDGVPGPTSQYFGINILGVRQLRDKLPLAVSIARPDASAASGDIQADLEALRNDVTRLTAQIADIFSSKGGAAPAARASTIHAACAPAAGKARIGRRRRRRCR